MVGGDDEVPPRGVGGSEVLSRLSPRRADRWRPDVHPILYGGCAPPIQIWSAEQRHPAHEPLHAQNPPSQCRRICKKGRHEKVEIKKLIEIN